MKLTKEEFLYILKNSIEISSTEDKNIRVLYLDENIIRIKKLNNILDTEEKIIFDYSNLNKEKLLIYYNIKHKEIFFDYVKIWDKIRIENFNQIFSVTKKIIGAWLKETTKWKDYIPYHTSYKIKNLEMFKNKNLTYKI